MSQIEFGQPLGMRAIQDRMAQLSQMMGDEVTQPSPGGPTFDSALNGAIGQQGFAPVNPLGNGTNVVPSSLKSLVQSSAIKNGIDPELFAALVNQESGFNPMSRSKAGAMGLTQLMPSTAAELGVTSPFDPGQNLDGGARYLKGLLNKFNSVPLALAAYNAGPEAVVRHGGIPPYSETMNYVRSIMSQYEANKGKQP